MTKDTDSDDSPYVNNRADIDLGPRQTHAEKYGVTEEGTADPETIRDDEIRKAVEEARRRKREQAEADADDGEPADTASDAGDGDAAAEPATAESPRLAAEPDDPDDFFADELGDPRRDLNEARAKGLHRDADQQSDHTETVTMTDDTTDTDSTDTQPTAADESIPRNVSETGERAASDAQARSDEQNDPTPGPAHPAAQDDARGASDATQSDAEPAADDDAAGDAEQVEPMTDAERAEVDDAVGASDDADEMPDIDSIDFEAQDIESASEDAGDQLIEFNDCYFVLSDVDEQSAENLMNALQDETLDPQDRFDVIIDTIVKKPKHASARTAGWKYLHRATLAGRCMEHCGLDDIVDFRDESDATPSQRPAE